ncbi:lipid droplet biogenesis associated protein seipin [Nomia melanderi]|uniref:lipid droplet biogenesis associated protein seipin n=1 Tax=Nomia melanderi TaxID=2448451 RepID=UPI00130421EF|nr:seipin [Nomia melanderi]
MLFSRLVELVNKKWFTVQKKTTRSVQSARHVILSGGIIMISGIFIIWLSVFLYTAFYYAYMPSMSHVRPVHLQFKSCNEEKGICSYPSARVQLTNKQQLLMVGQPYKVNLHLEMPESPVNKELGMFMVCASLHSRSGDLVTFTCRSAMMHYRSTLLHTLTTLTYLPMMIFGSTEEKQNVVLELFGNFEDDQNNPVTLIHIEIQSRHIELYSATVMINAHLSGLRYLMFHWPILSAIIGIGTNLFFIALVCTLSYFHFTTYEDSGDNNFSYEEEIKTEKKEERKKNSKIEEGKEHRNVLCMNDQTPDSSSSENAVTPDSSSSEDTFTPDFVDDVGELLTSTTSDSLKVYT